MIRSISTSLVLPAAGGLSVILGLNLDYSESVCYHLDHFCCITINFLMFMHIYRCCLLDYKSASTIQKFCVIYLCIVYFPYAVSEWTKIFKCYLVISFVCWSCICVCFYFSNFYNSLQTYIHMAVVTKIWLQHCSFDLIWITVLYFSRALSFNSILYFVLNLDSWVAVLQRKFMIF